MINFELPAPLKVENINDSFKRIVSFYETYFWTWGKYPEITAIAKGLDIPLEEVQEASIRLDEALQKRGLPPLKKKFELGEDEVDPDFVNAARLMVNTLDKRAKTKKLEAVGLTNAQWKSLLRRKANADYFKQLVDETWNSEVDQAAKLSLINLVESADLQAIKYYHEFTGQFVKRSINQNSSSGDLLTIIAKLMEVLARNLPDTKILDKIADEFLEIIDVSSTELKGELGKSP